MAWDDAPVLTVTGVGQLTATFSAGFPSQANAGAIMFSKSDSYVVIYYVNITKKSTSVVVNDPIFFNSYIRCFKYVEKKGDSFSDTGYVSNIVFVPNPTHTATLNSYAYADGTDKIALTINKNGSSLNTRVRLTGPGAAGTIIVATNAGTSLSWTVPTSLNASITGSERAYYTVNVDTMDGGTQIDTVEYGLWIYVPDTATYTPTASHAVAEAVTAINSITSGAVFVAGKSTLRVTANGSAGTGATGIAKREVIATIGGSTFTYDVTASPYYKDFTQVADTLTSVKVKITDSRGRIKESTATAPTIRAYSNPTISGLDAFRCTSGGAAANNGTYVKFIATITATSVKAADGTTELNVLAGSLNSSPVAGSNPLSSKPSNSTLTHSTWVVGVIVGGGNFNTNTSYTLTLTINDAFTSGIAATKGIPTELVPLSIGPNGIAIGKIYNDTTKALDVVGATLITGALTVTGTVSMTVPEHNQAGETITSGTIPEPRIPVLTAAKVPVLDSSKITTGTLGIDRIPVITPAKMTAATETDIGAAELATLDETRTGTDTTRYISPAGLAYANESSSDYGTLSGSGGTTEGGYVKMIDGTLICYVTCRITPSANSATFRTWTFPVAFSHDWPAVNVTAYTTSTTVDNTICSNSSTTSVKIGLVRTNATDTYISAIAIGRWK